MLEPAHGESLETSLSRLKRIDDAQLALGKQMFEAFGGAMYDMNLPAAGALNRSTAHSAGFRTLIASKNVICAGALLDFNSTRRCDSPRHSWRNGRPTSRLQSWTESGFATSEIATATRDGPYLVQRLGQEFPWVPRAYERTSGHIHLSVTNSSKYTPRLLSNRDADSISGEPPASNRHEDLRHRRGISAPVSPASAPINSFTNSRLRSWRIEESVDVNNS